MSDSDDSYGPALPPGMQSCKHNENSSDDDHYGPALPHYSAVSHKQDTNKDIIGPVLPTTSRSECVKDVVGPVLPTHCSKTTKYNKTSNYTSDSDSDSMSDCSSESDHSSRKSRKHKKTRTSDKERVKERQHVIGPAMPPDMRESNDELRLTDKRILGPATAHEGANNDHRTTDSDSDGDEIGPSLGLQATEQDLSAVKEFESRSQRMKEKLTSSLKLEDDEVPKQRESWMTELPDQVGVNFGLSSRQFRKRDAPEQDSGWTDAPHEKTKKNKDGKKRKKDKQGYILSDNDRKSAKEIEAYNKKHRPDSLLEMHKKELKKKKKKDKTKKKNKEKERRPFDRDIDLKVNRFDNAQKQAFIKKSQELVSRFKTGGTGTSFL